MELKSIISNTLILFYLTEEMFFFLHFSSITRLIFRSYNSEHVSSYTCTNDQIKVKIIEWLLLHSTKCGLRCVTYSIPNKLTNKPS